MGFSLGGQTSLATVTGINAAGQPADRRVKAALMAAGSNWGLLLDDADYANAKVPLLFFGNDTGIAYNDFNKLSGSREKYLIEVADYNHHIGTYQSGWCQDIRNSMLVVNPDVFPAVFFGGAAALEPSDIADYIFDATFYWVFTGPRNSGFYDYCEPSDFDGISNEQLVAVLFGNPQILNVRDELIGSMPLKREATIAEIRRGLAGGHTRAHDLDRAEPVSFSELRDRGSIVMPFGSEDAIFEQFFAGTGRACGGRN